MRIAIVDDEVRFASALAARVRECCPGDSVETFYSGESYLAASPAELLLLDIEMQGKSGMETARELRLRGDDTLLIFITGDRDAVFESFAVEAFSYLVKPVDIEALRRELSRAKKKLSEKASDTAEPAITVKSGGTVSRVKLKDLIYAEVYGRIVLLHTTRGDIQYYGSLGDLEATVGNDFFRTHRSFLVNLSFVERYHSTEITLDGGSVPLTKRKYSAFVHAYLEFCGRAAR